MERNVVAIINDPELIYPQHPPFNPSISYPEYPFDEVDSRGNNNVYGFVRELFKQLGYDLRNYGTEKWNPLSAIIKKGDTVVIKPNLVFHKNLRGDTLFSIITHPSVIRVLIDYVYKATGDSGKIIIADAPQHDTDFNKILEVSGLNETIAYLRENFSLPLEVYDLRKEMVVYRDGVIVKRIRLPGDPKGYAEIDLDGDSEFSEFSDEECRKFYGADYNRKETYRYHNSKRHAYVISKTILDADVIINVPKLKTHTKAGLTVALKNMIGIIGNKNSVPHFRIGSPEEGGDEFMYFDFSRSIIRKLDRWYRDNLLSKNVGSNLYRLLIKLERLIKLTRPLSTSIQRNDPMSIASGNWIGNDTLWRGILDINKIIFYADKSGKLCEAKQRKMFTVVDGIICGAGNGPLTPKARHCGLLIGGVDPVIIDLLCSELMGFKKYKPAVIRNAFKIKKYKLYNNAEVAILYNGMKVNNIKDLPNLYFVFPNGWKVNKLSL